VNSEFTAELSAAVLGIVVTVLWRLVDRYLPDPNQGGRHQTTSPAPPTRQTLPG
jgi:hypothetical protein